MIDEFLNYLNENEYRAFQKTIDNIREALESPTHYVKIIGDRFAGSIQLRLQGNVITINPWYAKQLYYQLSGVYLLIEVFRSAKARSFYMDRLLLVTNGFKGVELYINDGIDEYARTIDENDLSRAARYDVFHPLKVLVRSIILSEWKVQGAWSRVAEGRGMVQLKMEFRWWR